MGRPRTVAVPLALERAERAFLATGYAGTSVDDLVAAVGLRRGSLYREFGSKRGLFLAVLRHRLGASSPSATSGELLDLLLVAAQERGRDDAEVAGLVRMAAARLAPTLQEAATLLGSRLLTRLHPEHPDDAEGDTDGHPDRGR